MIKKFFTGQFQVLTVSLLAMLILSPYFASSPLGQISITILYCFILLSAIYSLREQSHNLLFFSFIATLYIFASIAYFLWPMLMIQIFERVVLIIFGFTATVAIYNDVAAAKKVTKDTYFAAISVYLLIGVTYGTLFSLIEFIQPGSFIYGNLHLAGGDIQNHLIYYSFITLTTVGYGDLVVVSQYAKPFVILESITGIFYLAMLVARLVASHTK